MTTLYHGFYVAVPRPQAARGRRCLDFGQGFYLTNLRTQADRWAQVVTERKTLNHQLCIISQIVIDRCLCFTEAVDLKPEAL